MSNKSKDKKTRRADKSPELTEAEWEIMRIVWREQPCAAGTVQEAMVTTRKWAYSTVKTTLDRMMGKGLLTVTRIRNLQLFSSAISESDAKQSEVFKTLKRAFNGALTPMMQFLLESEDISEDDLKELRKLVSSHRRK
jgi:BlaI family penicillinase repressor